jgi:hypothetical protein
MMLTQEYFEITEGWELELNCYYRYMINDNVQLQVLKDFSGMSIAMYWSANDTTCQNGVLMKTEEHIDIEHIEQVIRLLKK